MRLNAEAEEYTLNWKFPTLSVCSSRRARSHQRTKKRLLERRTGIFAIVSHSRKNGLLFGNGSKPNDTTQQCRDEGTKESLVYVRRFLVDMFWSALTLFPRFHGSNGPANG